MQLSHAVCPGLLCALCCPLAALARDQCHRDVACPAWHVWQVIIILPTHAAHVTDTMCFTLHVVSTPMACLMHATSRKPCCARSPTYAMVVHGDVMLVCARSLSCCRRT